MGEMEKNKVLLHVKGEVYCHYKSIFMKKKWKNGRLYLLFNKKEKFIVNINVFNGRKNYFCFYYMENISEMVNLNW